MIDCMYNKCMYRTFEGEKKQSVNVFQWKTMDSKDI